MKGDLLPATQVLFKWEHVSLAMKERVGGHFTTVPSVLTSTAVKNLPKVDTPIIGVYTTVIIAEKKKTKKSFLKRILNKIFW